MRILSLFDGISCGQLALTRAGIPIEIYYASEIDKYAMQVTQKNFPKTIQLGDVSKIDFTKFIRKIDMIIGGSPCQDLSIAKANRQGLQGQRSGLFYKFVEAIRTIKPKYFLLENVASMSKENKDIITKKLGVEPIMINSALVSAQQRKRLYWCNWKIEQPKDKGIILKDILESDETWNDKSYSLTASYNGAVFPHDYLRKQRQMVAMPVPEATKKGFTEIQQGDCVDLSNMNSKTRRGRNMKDKSNCLTASECQFYQYIKPCALRNRGNGKQPELNKTDKANALTTVQTDSMVCQPISDNYFRKFGSKGKILNEDTDKSNTLTASAGTGGGNVPAVAKRVGGFYGQNTRWGIYSETGKSPTLTASMGLGGGHVPMTPVRLGQVGKGHQGERVYSVKGKSMCLSGDGGGKAILTKIDLPDGEYIIRKFTPIECERLQTLPDNYTEGVSKTQRYKAIGNGWTVDVIAHMFRELQKNKTDKKENKWIPMEQLEFNFGATI